MFRRLIVLFALVLYCLHAISLGWTKDHDVVVKGNDRIPKETVITYAGIHNKTDGNSTQTEQIVKNLYATNFFADVKVEHKNSNIVITVEENPIIRKIAFEGNKAINDESLIKIIKLRPKDVYLPSQIHNDSIAIETAFNKQGYYGAFVEPQIIKLPGNRVDLIYAIKQGDKAKIKKINFVGNEDFHSDELKKNILSREFAFYRFFSSADMYDPDKVLMDKELLKRFYQFNGYFDFTIQSTTSELTPAKDGFIITFLISEGVKYKIKDFIIATNIKGLPKEKLSEKITLKKGAVLSLAEIEKSEDAITKYLGGRGYAFVEVTHDIIKNAEKGEAIIKFVVVEGSKVYINKININNNTRTMDKVIRRKMRIEEGDHYSNTLLERSKAEIINLGYFSVVDFKNKRTEYADKIDIDIDVKETGTGSMNFLIGYNDQSGFMGSVSVTENNFLGKGQSVELSLSKSAQSSQVMFGFTESGFLNQPIDAGFDVYANKTEDKYSKYRNREIGGGVRMQYELFRGIYHGIRYNLKHFKVSQSGANPSLTVRDFSGPAYNSSIGQTFSWAALDSGIRPSRGVKFEFAQDLAGVGGDTYYIKNQVIANIFIPLYKRDVVLNFSARAGALNGINNKRVRLMDNFHLEQDALRGFEPSGISPRDAATGDAIGSKNYCAGTAEISFPLGLPEEIGLTGVAFIDAATMFGYDLNPIVANPPPTVPPAPAVVAPVIHQSTNIRSAYGVGIIWRSPFGKIKVNYGIPITKERFDNTQRITLSMGGMF